MGASASQTKLEEQVKSSLGIDLVNQIESSCQLAVDAHQKISLGNVSGSEVSGISQTIDPDTALTSCKISAALNAVQGTDASQDLISSLEQAQMTSGFGALSVQNLDALKVLETETDIALKNQIINECQQKIDISQTFEVGNISDAKISDISQVNKSFNECVMEGLGDTVQKATAAQSVTSNTVATQETQGLFGGEYGSLVLGMIALGIVAMFVMGRTGGGYSQPSFGPNPAPAPRSNSALVMLFVVVALLSVFGVTYFVFVSDEESNSNNSNSNNSNSKNSEVSASNEEAVNVTTSETEKESFEGFNGDYYYNYI